MDATTEKIACQAIFLLEFPDFCDQQISPEVEAELEILGFVFCDIESPFVREEKVIQPIGYAVVEERRDSKKPLRDKESGQRGQVFF